MPKNPIFGRHSSSLSNSVIINGEKK